MAQTQLREVQVEPGEHEQHGSDRAGSVLRRFDCSFSRENFAGGRVTCEESLSGFVGGAGASLPTNLKGCGRGGASSSFEHDCDCSYLSVPKVEAAGMDRHSDSCEEDTDSCGQDTESFSEPSLATTGTSEVCAVGAMDDDDGDRCCRPARNDATKIDGGLKALLTRLFATVTLLPGPVGGLVGQLN